jgi:hypothetical protein
MQQGIHYPQGSTVHASGSLISSGHQGQGQQIYMTYQMQGGQNGIEESPHMQEGY